MNNIKINKEEDFKPFQIDTANTNSSSINIKERPKSPEIEKDVQYDPSDVKMFSNITSKPIFGMQKSKINFKDDEEDFSVQEKDVFDGSENDEEYSNQYDNNYRDELTEDDEDDYGGYQEYTDNYSQGVESRSYQKHNLNPEEIKARKAHYLWKLNKLNGDNRYSSAILDMGDDLETIENEYIRVEKQIENETGIEMIKNTYVGAASFIEFFSSRQKIVALNLTNWSYKVAIESNRPNYEKVFSQIYDKYLSTIEASDPLLTLAFMTVMSAASYHYSNNPTDINTQRAMNVKNVPVMESPDDDLDSIVEKLKEQEIDNLSDISSISSVKIPDIIIKKQEQCEDKPKKKRGRPPKQK